MKDNKSAKFVPAKRCSRIVNIRRERKILAGYQAFYIRSARVGGDNRGSRILASTHPLELSYIRDSRREGYIGHKYTTANSDVSDLRREFLAKKKK